MSSIFVGLSLVIFAHFQPDTGLVVQHYCNFNPGSLSRVSQLALNLHARSPYPAYAFRNSPMYLPAREPDVVPSAIGHVSTMEHSPSSTDWLILTISIRAPALLFG